MNLVFRIKNTIFSILLLYILAVPIYYPIISNGIPIWLLVITFFSDIIITYIHQLGHAITSARYMFGNLNKFNNLLSNKIKYHGITALFPLPTLRHTSEHYPIQILVSLFHGGIKIKSFDYVNDYKIKRKIILAGLFNNLIMAIMSLVVFLIFREHNGDFFMRILSGGIGRNNFPNFSLEILCFYFMYINIAKLLISLLPISRFDGEVLLISHYEKKCNSSDATVKTRFLQIFLGVFILLSSLILLLIFKEIPIIWSILFINIGLSTSLWGLGFWRNVPDIKYLYEQRDIFYP